MEFPLWDDYPNVIRMQQFSREALEAVVSHCCAFEKALTEGKEREELPRLSQSYPWRVRSLFYEPSTRTSTTFKDAAERLGCSVDDVKDPGTFSSAVKGESFEEAIAAFTVTGGLGHMRGCDLLVLRHHENGASTRAAKVIETALRGMKNALPLPVINAGDGSGQHPTQALVDLVTIWQEKRNTSHPLERLHILFPGDLGRSRVISSLLYALGKFGHGHAIKAIFCCPDGFGPKAELLEYLARNNVRYVFARPGDFRECLAQADIIYMTRVQRERKHSGSKQFTNKAREQLVLRKEHISLLKPTARVMHPLPINRDLADPPAEIEEELVPLAQAGDQRLVWMRQSHRGLSTRMALLDLIFAGLDEHRARLQKTD